MARGHQKIQSQMKNQEKKAAMKKVGTSQKKSAEQALVYKCTVCMSMMPDPKTYKQHFESKHPKNPLPAELQQAFLVGIFKKNTYVTREDKSFVKR